MTPLNLSFSATSINATSARQNITISNTGGATLSLQTPSVTGDFKLIANTCGSTLASSTGCTVSVVFTPTTSGTRTGTFTITDDAGTQIASLMGIGTSPATDALSPSSLAFAPQQLGTSSAAQVVTLTNSGDVALSLIAAQILSGDFIAVNSCGASLNAHSSCSIVVSFQPKSLGPTTGLLAVSDEYGRTQNVTLTGIGTAPPGVSLSPLFTLNFPVTGIGVNVLSQIVTLTNNDNFPLTLTSTTLTGDFAIAPGTNTCPSGPNAILAANSACTMQLIFTPVAGGLRTGALTIVDDAPNSPHVLRLTGTAVGFTLEKNGDTTVTINSGQSAVFPLLLTPAASTPGSAAATFTCTGAPANATCTVTPDTVSLDSIRTISVTVLTGTTTASSSSPSQSRILWLAALLPLGLLALRRHRLSGLAVLGSLIVLVGCGSGRRIPGTGGSDPTPPTQVTPVGTYTIIASASCAGLTRSVNLTLIVK
ncbi:MAG: BNR/Asp-box repeat protein [Edaphobacter sp.]|nr:BNR/Asp-box repeat protein [Edaphobacter sp.]